MKKSDLIFNSLLLPFDFITLLIAAWAAYFVRISPLVADFRPVLFDLSFGYFMTLSAVLALFFVIVFALTGLYAMQRKAGMLQEITRVMVAVSAGMMLVIIFMFFNRAWFDSRFIILAGWMFAIIFVSFQRMGARATRAFLRRQLGIGLEHVMLLGKESATQQLESTIAQHRGGGLKVVATLATPDIQYLKKVYRPKRLHHIIVADSKLNRDDLLQVVSFCEERGIQFSYIPDLFGSMVADMRFDVIRGVPVVSVKASPLDGWGRVVKRAVDILGAGAGLIVLAPFFLLIALVIRWESKGPVFVGLKRVSQGEKFNLYKFRSMINNAQIYKVQFAHLNERNDGPLFKITEDPRVTPFGRFLRRHRFDELPQLFNALAGDISLVGPRPHEPGEVEKYTLHHKKILAMKGGLTGFAQVSGASDLSFEEEVKLDRYYIENWSMKKDILILLRTLRMLFFDKSGV